MIEHVGVWEIIFLGGVATAFFLLTVYRLRSRRGARFEQIGSTKVLQIIDGDTVDVRLDARRVRVRLDAIDCPEDGQLWGDTARYGLIKLIGGKSVRLEEHGRDHYGRTLATIYVRDKRSSEWINVNERMVLLGHAWVMRKYWGHLSRERQINLNRLESWAKSKRVGLWKTPDPIPPWEWRKRNF